MVFVHCQVTPPHTAGAGGGADGGGDGAAAATAPAPAFGSHAAATEHRQSMQRLVRALGGRVCGPRAADVCVMCGSTSCARVPQELPPAGVAVREEWLLQVAETHEGAERLQPFRVTRTPA
jgi:hypothetical protein